jgi:outer membrane protein assembly factor BamD (BamD/ComL family)
VVAYVFTIEGRSGARPGSVRQAGLRQEIPGQRRNVLSRFGRRQSTGRSPRQTLGQQEESARQLLAEASAFLNQGKFEEALERCKTIDELFPETETAELVRQRMPVLERVLENQRAEMQARAQENEDAARRKYDLAMELYSDGDRITSLELLKSIVADYPDTDTAAQAESDAARIGKELTDEESERQENDAAALLAQAETLMAAEQYREAAELYKKIATDYPQTSVAVNIRPMLEQVELIISDLSELAFYETKKALDTKTYEEAISLLQGLLEQFPNSNRADEIMDLIEENENNKRDADNLYNFGRAHFEEENYRIAIGRYEKLIREYPRSRRIPQAKRDNKEALERLQE